MDTELNRQELIEAKKQARGRRIRTIRKRVATAAVILVAAFSGTILFRSLEQQVNTTTTTEASVSRSDDESSLVDQVASVFVEASDDFGEDEDDDDSSSTSTSTDTTAQVPLVTSQS